MIKKYILIFIPVLGLLLSCSSPQKKQSAEKQLTGKIEIPQSWVRPAAKGTNSAGYFSIYNGTQKADTLIGIESQGAENAEVHESYTTDEGLSGMRPAEVLAIPSGDSLILEPGGYHVMLMNVKRDFAAGDTLELILKFSGISPINVSAPVKE